jgi:NUAK family SNF1-like kinase
MSKEAKEQLSLEIELLRLLSEEPNTYIIKIFDVFEDTQKIMIVMDYIEAGHMYNWVKDNHTTNENTIKLIFAKICLSIQFLHNRGIVHRDIKLENILLQPSKQFGTLEPKLIDFGLSAVVTTDEWLLENCGSLAFCSPEIVSNLPHSMSTDVWSLGIVLYTLLTKRMPFVDFTWDKTVLNIVGKPINFNQSCWSGKTYLGKDLVFRMLIKDPLGRLNIHQVL